MYSINQSGTVLMLNDVNDWVVVLGAEFESEVSVKTEIVRSLEALCLLIINR